MGPEEFLKDLEKKLTELYRNAVFESAYHPDVNMAYITGYFREINMTVRKRIDIDAIQSLGKDRMFMYLIDYIDQRIIDHFKTYCM